LTAPTFARLPMVSRHIEIARHSLEQAAALSPIKLIPAPGCELGAPLLHALAGRG